MRWKIASVQNQSEVVWVTPIPSHCFITIYLFCILLHHVSHGFSVNPHKKCHLEVSYRSWCFSQVTITSNTKSRSSMTWRIWKDQTWDISQCLGCRWVSPELLPLVVSTVCHSHSQRPRLPSVVASPECGAGGLGHVGHVFGWWLMRVSG